MSVQSIEMGTLRERAEEATELGYSTLPVNPDVLLRLLAIEAAAQEAWPWIEVMPATHPRKALALIALRDALGLKP